MEVGKNGSCVHSDCRFGRADGTAEGQESGKSCRPDGASLPVVCSHGRPRGTSFNTAVESHDPRAETDEEFSSALEK